MYVMNIWMTQPGVELVIAALNELPHKQVAELIQEIWAQYQAQLQPAQAGAPEEAEADADAS